MIVSWKNTDSEKLWQMQMPPAFRGLDKTAALDLLLVLNIARHRDDLSSLRSAGLRRVKRHGKKRWTIAIDHRWRIRFDVRNGDAHDVKIVGKAADRHKAGEQKSNTANTAKTDKGHPRTPAIYPGRFLRRELAARQLSANRLALDLGVPSGRIIDILNARRAISADTAVRLGRYLGMRAQFWLDLQGQFDIAVVETKKGAEIGRRVRRPDR